MAQRKKSILKEKLIGISLCLLQLLLTIILLSLLLIFKILSRPLFIFLAAVLFCGFAINFLSQQSRRYRITGKFVALGLDLLLIVSCIMCFVIR